MEQQDVQETHGGSHRSGGNAVSWSVDGLFVSGHRHSPQEVSDADSTRHFRYWRLLDYGQLESSQRCKRVYRSQSDPEFAKGSSSPRKRYGTGPGNGPVGDGSSCRYVRGPEIRT